MGKTTIMTLTAIVVILLALNVFQYYYFNYMTRTVPEEDVPIPITELNGEGWRDFIGKKVTVDGYYFERGSIRMLVSNPELLFMDAPVGADNFVLLSGEISDAMENGSRYHVKGTVQSATQSDQKVTLAFQSCKFIESSHTPFIESAFHITVTASPQPVSTKYAVLISGGVKPTMAYLRYWNDMKYMYSILINRYHYDPKNIYVLYKDGVAEDSEMPVNYSASLVNIQLVFITLATKLTANDYLFLFTNNHGGTTPDTNGDEPEATNKMDETLCLYYSEVTDDQLKFMLDAITCYRMIIFMKQCFSGGFIHDLSAPNRVIMTACTQDQTSWSADTEGSFGEFSYHFMKAVNNEVAAADTDGNGWISMAEAFNYAARMDSRPETPQYDDNGDGIGHSYPITAGATGDGVQGNSYL